MQKEKVKTISIIVLSIGIVVLLFALTSALLLVGVSSTDDYASTSSTNQMIYTNETMSTKDNIESSTYTPDDNTRDIQKEGSIVGESDDIEKTIKEIDSVMSQYKTVIENTYDSGTGLNRYISMTVNVEATSFDAVYSALKDLDINYTYSNISTLDVTDTVTDLEAQLNTYKDLETKMLEVLDMATTVEEVLNVQTELSNIRYNIESITKQLENTNKEVEYSTIQIEISQSQGSTVVPDDEWKPVSVFKTAVRSLIEFAQFLGSLLIWIVVFSPIALLVVIPIVIVKKKRKQSS